MKIKFLTFTFLFILASCSSLQSNVTGEVFVVTKDAGNYPLGAVSVKFFKKKRIDDIKSNKQQPAYEALKPDAETITGADGKFSLDISSGDYVVYAKSSRSVFDKTEDYFWEVPFNSSASKLILSNQNLTEK